jgi:hypothetical protein
MTLHDARRNPSMKAAQMRAAQRAIAMAPEVREVLTDAMEGLALAAAVLDAWEGADAPTRALVRRYAPALGLALDKLEAGPE